jgi:hypothetical protein
MSILFSINLVKLKLADFLKFEMYTYFGTEGYVYPATYACMLHALRSDAVFFFTVAFFIFASLPFHLWKA